MNTPKKLSRKEKDALSRQAAATEPRHKKKGSSKQSDLLPAILIFVFGFLLYAGTIGYEYTLDDFAAINSNNHVQKGIAGIGDIIQSSYWSGYNAANHTLYRPVPLILFALEWQFFPNNPAAGHFMNVLLYALTGVLLFRLLNRLFNHRVLLSFAAALLFLAHPVHTEVVANIKSCDEILCLLFCVLSLSLFLDFLDNGKTGMLARSAGAFFLALLSKENAITWLAIMPLAAVVFRNIAWKKAITQTIPFAGVAVLYLLILTGIQHGVLVSKPEALTNNILADAPGFLTRLATALFVLGKYVWLLFFPLHLSVDYSYAAIKLMSFADSRVLLSVGVILALAVGGIFLLRKKNVAGFWILYFFITISLVSNVLFVIGTVMADRLLYMPSLGLAVMVAWLLDTLFSKKESTAAATELLPSIRSNPMAVGLCAAVLVLYSAKTLARNPVWSNNLALFTAGMSDEPGNGYVHYLYSNELIKRVTSPDPSGKALRPDSVYPIALSNYLKAVAIDSTNAGFNNEVAATYRKMKKTEEALKFYDQALKYNPRLPQAYNGKGVLYFERKEYREALKYFGESARLNPNDATTLLNLGSCYLVLNDNVNAITWLGKSLQYKPNDPVALKYLGYAYENTGDKKTAEEYFARAKAAEAMR